jgi:hypothetical protein
MFSLDSINLICGCMVGVEYEELEDNSFLIVDLFIFQFIFIKQK